MGQAVLHLVAIINMPWNLTAYSNTALPVMHTQPAESR